jgi:hypothetical protein
VKLPARWRMPTMQKDGGAVQTARTRLMSVSELAFIVAGATSSPSSRPSDTPRQRPLCRPTPAAACPGVTPPRDPPRLRPGPGATSAGVVSDAAWLHDFAATLRPGAQRSAPQPVVASPLTSRAGLPRCAEVSVASAGDSVLQTLEVGRPGRGGRLGLGWTPSGRSSRPATQTPPRSSPRQRTGRPTPGGVRRCAC